MKKILIIQRSLLQYRIDFYNLLKENLLKENVEIDLIYSKETLKGEKLKKDEGYLEWAKMVHIHTIEIGKFHLYFQNPKVKLNKYDLIIIEQANKQIFNYILMIGRLFNKYKLAFWGHGINRQINENSYKNKFKLMYSKNCDWWFAYTDSVKNKLISIGYDANKITSVNNATNTEDVKQKYNSITNEEIPLIKQKYNLGNGPIGIFCGSIYKEKEIDFLLKAVEVIKVHEPEFEMIIIGAGIDDFKVTAFSHNKEWFHYLGPKFGMEKVQLLKVSDVFLMPGLVGLAILDAFATETPIITTNYPYHSPEIDYLSNGNNGLITKYEINEYSEAIINLFHNKDLKEKLKYGCRESSKIYTIERMVNGFMDGINKCLENNAVKKN